MIVTIHQPEHLVWLGLIDKVNKSDMFVILDTVQYRKGYFQNRNKIRTKEGWVWLSVPLIKHSFDTQIKDIKISYTENWQKKYLQLIKTNYSKAKFFNDYFPRIEGLINKNYERLVDLNVDLIMFFLESFGVEGKKILRSSELDLPFITGGSNVNLAICKKLEADIYLSGPTGVEYLVQEDYQNSNIKILFHHFDYPTYSQQFEGFLPGMSSLDALFNLGPEVGSLILNNK